MKCISCGHCCRTMSPINHGRCPLLLETAAETGTVYHCADYENRPQECRDHTYPATVCPVGVSTLNLINSAMIEARILEVNNVLRAKSKLPF